MHGPVKELYRCQSSEASIGSLKENKLEVNAEKSKLDVKEINIPGTVGSKNRTKPDPRKVEVIYGFEAPENVTQLKSFL